MKRLFLLISFFLSLISLDAQLKFPAAGIANGPFAFSYQGQITGVPQSVQHLTDRNAIPLYLRTMGMTCYVADSLKYYYLKTGITDTSWYELTFNSTGDLSAYYTQTQINNFFNGTTPITGYNYSNWDAKWDSSVAKYFIGNNYLDLNNFLPQTVTGSKTFAQVTYFNQTLQMLNNNGVYFLTGSTASPGYYIYLKKPTSITTSRTITLPDATGTIALTSDIPTNNNALTNGADYASRTQVNTSRDSVQTNLAAEIARATAAEATKVNQSTTITINGTTLDLSANRTFTVSAGFTPNSDTTVTANYTCTARDAGRNIFVNSSSSVTISMPQDSDASIAYTLPQPQKTITVWQQGTGAVVIAAGTGATVSIMDGASTIIGRYGAATLVKQAANTWYGAGALK